MTDRPIWQVEFESSEFLPCLPESSQVNPGIYGFELALWAAQVVSTADLEVSYPHDEDWGWFVDAIGDDGEATIHCFGRGDECAAYSGRALTWQMRVLPYRNSFRQWLRGEWPTSVFDRVVATVSAALSAKGIDFRRAEDSIKMGVRK